MSDEGTNGEAPVSVEGLRAQVDALRGDAARRAAEAKALKARAALLAPLTNPALWLAPAKLGRAAAKVRKKAPADAPEVVALLDAVDAFVREAPERAKRELSVGLRRACAERDLELLVVRREPPAEVRIPPVSVVFDFAKAQAEIRFARQPLATCAATVDEVMRCRERVVAQLEAAFDPERYLAACLRAYRLALADAGRSFGERIEILDFLPLLALALQDRRFAQEPSAKNFRPYGRARFAYDIWRLQREGHLSDGTHRLNLGVATGTTGGQKRRVIYFEDGHGVGENKLTVFFTRG
jgi:hypothetical protein